MNYCMVFRDTLETKPLTLQEKYQIMSIGMRLGSMANQSLREYDDECLPSDEGSAKAFFENRVY